MKPDVFRRPDGYIRYDFRWYGFGYRRDYNAAHGGMAHTYWINSYIKAPLSISWLNNVGWLEKSEYLYGTLRLHGSGGNPYWGWSLRIKQVFIGGNLPKLLQKLLKFRDSRRALQYEENFPPDFA